MAYIVGKIIIFSYCSEAILQEALVSVINFEQSNKVFGFFLLILFVEMYTVINLNFVINLT